MTLEGIARFQTVRVNPFEGLIVDAATWGDAHGYHRDQQRLHALTSHGEGIVAGLRVCAHNPPDMSVTIWPGVAVDGEGNAIVVAQPQRYYLQARREGVAYLVIQFREIPLGEGGRPAESLDGASRIREAYRIQQRDSLPTEPYVELARVQLTVQTSAVADADLDAEPRAGMLDLRFRKTVALASRGEIAIGRLVPAQGGQPSCPRHSRGLSFLCRQLALAEQIQGRFLGPVKLGEDTSHCDLLYLDACQRPSFNSSELAEMESFLRRGGVVLIEPCTGEAGGSANDELRVFFDALAQRLGGARAIDREHAILRVRHVFAAAPAGGNPEGALLEAGGLIFSERDYGCAWQGGRGSTPLDRETIRSATELGVNLAYFAVERRLAALTAAL